MSELEKMVERLKELEAVEEFTAEQLDEFNALHMKMETIIIPRIKDKLRPMLEEMVKECSPCLDWHEEGIPESYAVQALYELAFDVAKGHISKSDRPFAPVDWAAKMFKYIHDRQIQSIEYTPITEEQAKELVGAGVIKRRLCEENPTVKPGRRGKIIEYEKSAVLEGYAVLVDWDNNDIWAYDDLTGFEEDVQIVANA